MDCKSFFESRQDEVKDGVIHTTYINPSTKRRIKQCSPAYNKLLADCNAMITGKPRIARARSHMPTTKKTKKTLNTSPVSTYSNKSSKPKKHKAKESKQITDIYVKEWIEMPRIDPRTKRRIYPYMRPTSEYAILYKIAYEYLVNAGFKHTVVQNMLPREHYLFNDIDILYYRINPEAFTDQKKQLYIFLDQFLQKHSGDTPDYNELYFDTNYSIDEHNIALYIINKLVDVIAKYMKYMHIFFKQSYERFPMYIDELKEYRDTMHTIKYFVDQKNIMNEVFQNKVIAYVEKALKQYKQLYFNTALIMPKLKTNNFIDTLTAWYDELYNTFNYIRNPDMSPYADLLIKVEDPIERMFQRLTHDTEAQQLHKVLSDVGVLDLLQQGKKGILRGSLLNKTRKFITGKCNNKTDPITQDNYVDDVYPLSKLQLMYILKNKKHAHCFYAPEFYNYVVSEISAGKEIIRNPLTNEALTNNDIKALIDVMRVVYPNIKDPLHYIGEKPFDTKLELAITHTRHRNGITYCHMNIMRKLGDIPVRICNVCVIPKNMDKSRDFVKLITRLFNDGDLLYTYMSPFYINDDMYIRYDDIVCTYQEVEEWSNMKEDLQNKELTDYYNDIRKAFTI